MHRDQNTSDGEVRSMPMMTLICGGDYFSAETMIQKSEPSAGKKKTVNFPLSSSEDGTGFLILVTENMSSNVSSCYKSH